MNENTNKKNETAKALGNRPFDGIAQMHGKSVDGLSSGMTSYKDLDIAIVEAAGNMKSGGSNPELDGKILDLLNQIHNDNYTKETESSNRVERNNDLWVYIVFASIGIGSGMLVNSECAKNLGFMCTDYAGKLWGSVLKCFPRK